MGGTGKRKTGAGRQPTREAERRTTASRHPPVSEKQDDEEDGGTGKQREGEPDGMDDMISPHATDG